MFNTVIYIHGFTGSHGYNPNSEKVIAIKKYCTKNKWNFIASNYPDDNAHESYTYLTKLIRGVLRADPHPILIGTSLGGFWAHYLSNQFRLPSIIINPAMQPWDQLAHNVGTAGFTTEKLHTFADYKGRSALPGTVYEPRVVLLEAGDKLLDSYATAKAFKGHCRVELISGGNHQFTSYNRITNAMAEIHNTMVQHGS